MRPGVYKHKRNTDVAAKIVQAVWVAQEKGWNVKILWLNIVNPNNVYLIDQHPSSYFIDQENVELWEPYDAAV